MKRLSLFLQNFIIGFGSNYKWSMCTVGYPVKSPRKKPLDKSPRTISNRSESLLDQKLSWQNTAPSSKPPKTICSQINFPHQTNFPSQKGVLVNEERGVLTLKHWAAYVWEHLISLAPLLVSCSNSERSEVRLSTVGPKYVMRRRCVKLWG